MRDQKIYDHRLGYVTVISPRIIKQYGLVCTVLEPRRYIPPQVSPCTVYRERPAHCTLVLQLFSTGRIFYQEKRTPESVNGEYKFAEVLHSAEGCSEDSGWWRDVWWARKLIEISCRFVCWGPVEWVETETAPSAGGSFLLNVFWVEEGQGSECKNDSISR